MDFKEYINYRSNQDDEIGVIAYDLIHDIPFEMEDEKLFKLIESSVKGIIYDNWISLKTDYLAQK